jgi:hypothetical protein
VNPHSPRPGVAPIHQFAVAYPFLAVMWLVCGMAASSGGELSGILLAAVVFPIFTMVFAVAVGLPLRLNRWLSRWWLGNYKAYILTAAGGAALIASGFMTSEHRVGVMDGYHYDVVTRHGGMLIGGCFVLTFLAVNAGFRRRTTPEEGGNRSAH